MKKVKTTFLIISILSLTVLSCSRNHYTLTDDNNPLLEDIKRDGVIFKRDLMEAKAVFHNDNDSTILSEVK